MNCHCDKIERAHEAADQSLVTNRFLITHLQRKDHTLRSNNLCSQRTLKYQRIYFFCIFFLLNVRKGFVQAKEFVRQ